MDARAAPRSTFSSAGVKSLLMPISPMIPAQTSGSSSETPQSLAIGLGDRLDGHIPDVGGMRGLEIKARAHHDVEARAPADTLQRRRVAADAEIRRVDDGPAAVFDEMREFLDRSFDVEELRNCRG